MDIPARQKIIDDLLPKKFGTRGRIWVAVLVIICIIGVVAYARQLSSGLVVTAMRDYASWGIYISNFVFFVAISLVGSLITAVLRLVNVKWSTPLTRIAEIIAVSAITFASIIIVVDMGRPERFYNLFLHGRLQSPIIWDVIVITTYFFISLLLLYFPLLPDFKIMIESRKVAGKFINKMYSFLGSFWKNTPIQIKISDRSIRIIVNHDHTGCICHSYGNILALCHYLPAGLGQYQFWCLFYIRRVFGGCGRSFGGDVYIPECISSGKIYHDKSFRQDGENCSPACPGISLF